MAKPLFWHQGLFLQPQHFQLDNLYARSLVAPLHTYLSPHFWGVGNIRILETALDNYSFEITSGEFLFPDMTHVVLNDNALLEPRTFEDEWSDGGKTFKVYLGLRKWSDDGDNVAILPEIKNLSTTYTRFVSLSDPEEMKDLHHKGPAAEVKQMSYLLRIFFENEIDQLGDYLLIPVALLAKSGESIVLSKKYIPPVLTLSGSILLEGIVKEITDQISSRSRQLESNKLDRGVHTAEFGSRDMVFMMALRSLNRYIPLLTHINASGTMHPWYHYGFLRQIVGELSSFSALISSTGELKDGKKLLQDYDHKDLWHCYHGIQELITLLLDDITAGPEYIIPLHWDGTYYSAELSLQAFDERNRYYLVLESEDKEEFIISSMNAIAKISSRKAMPNLILQALPGAKAKHLPTPPQHLPKRSGSIYFSIDHHSPHWQEVRENTTIALQWDSAPDDLKVDLMVIRRD